MESDAGPVPPVVLGQTQWPVATHTEGVQSAPPPNPPGRTINNETLPVSVKQSPLLAQFDLVVLHPYGLLACVSCGWGFGHDHAPGHLSRTHQNWGLTKAVATELKNDYSLRSHTELLACKPQGLVPELPVLKKLPGFACTGCDVVLANAESMNKHLRTHPRGSALSEPATLQLFLPASHSGYIHVQPVESTDAKSASDLVDEAIAIDRETFEPALIDNTDWRTIHPFLEISAWNVWIGNMKRKEVDALRLHLTASVELISDCRALIQTMWKCCTAENYAAWCHINSAT